MVETSLVKEPSQCSEEELQQFRDLLSLYRKGGVDALVLLKKVKRAELLGFHYENGQLVSIVALKKPFRTYKEKLFELAKFPEEAKKFDTELGWAFTREGYRDRNMASGLIGNVIAASDKVLFSDIYAVTHPNNLAMGKILHKNGFGEMSGPFTYRSPTYGEFLFQMFTRQRL